MSAAASPEICSEEGGDAVLPASCEAYLAALKHERKLSDHTLRSYRHELVQLQAVARGRSVTSLTSADVRGAAARAHAQGLAPPSIAHRLSVWRSFYRWYALTEGDLPANPVAAVRAPKRAKRLPKALSTDDAVALMESTAGGGGANEVEALRDRALLELFYSSGLRLAELIGLDVAPCAEGGYQSQGWVDLDAAEVVVTGKGGKRRVVPVGRHACDALRAYLAVRGTAVRADPRPLFLSARGARMAPGVVRRRVKQLAIAAGIPAHVHPHVLRHSFATHLLQSSGDLRAVQEMLGHASISSTQIYTALDFQHLARVYDTAHPRAKKRS